MAQQTELERCRAMSDQELLDHIREDARYTLWPAVIVLLGRVEVKPEEDD